MSKSPTQSRTGEEAGAKKKKAPGKKSAGKSARSKKERQMGAPGGRTAGGPQAPREGRFPPFCALCLPFVLPTSLLGRLGPAFVPSPSSRLFAAFYLCGPRKSLWNTSGRGTTD